MYITIYIYVLPRSVTLARTYFTIIRSSYIHKYNMYIKNTQSHTHTANSQLEYGAGVACACAQWRAQAGRLKSALSVGLAVSFSLAC